jgi:hypothetical protein
MRLWLCRLVIVEVAIASGICLVFRTWPWSNATPRLWAPGIVLAVVIVLAGALGARRITDSP